jgi:hypothetical protein
VAATIGATVTISVSASTALLVALTVVSGAAGVFAVGYWARELRRDRLVTGAVGTSQAQYARRWRNRN